MTKRRLMFNFPEELIREPIIYNLGQQFNVVTNILRADTTRGWIELELDGDDEGIEAGIAWVVSKGVRVEPVSDEIVKIEKEL